MTRALRTPVPVARLGIGLAARALPTREARERYRAEFLAELTGLTPAEQLRYTCGVLSQASALRTALCASPALPQGVPRPVPFGRWIQCHVVRWHDWRTYRTDDGERYSQCSRCGRFPVDTISHNSIGV
jgi:hypothetical protein